jgi:hypothetical protein
MTDPRQAEVWGKKPEVADRTLNERKYCKPCDYYYSEMFTCPICYGDDRAVERIIKMLEEQINWLLDQKTFDRTAEAEVWIRVAKLVSKERSK